MSMRGSLILSPSLCHGPFRERMSTFEKAFRKMAAFLWEHTRKKTKNIKKKEKGHTSAVSWGMADVIYVNVWAGVGPLNHGFFFRGPRHSCVASALLLVSMNIKLLRLWKEPGGAQGSPSTPSVAVSLSVFPSLLLFLKCFALTSNP